MTSPDTTIDIPHVTGAAAYSDYLGLRFRQGGRTTYSITVPVAQVPAVIAKPDPTVRLDSNRRVKPRHAESFATYITTNPSWHCGALTGVAADTEVVVTMLDQHEGAPVRMVKLSIPSGARLSCIDGQHPRLGAYRAALANTIELDDCARLLGAATTNGSAPAVVKSLRERQAAAKEVARRLREESIAIQVVVENEVVKRQQMFYDVTHHAVGVTKSEQVAFDSSTPVNRVAQQLAADPTVQLLHGRVDDESSRIGATSPMLVTLADVARLVLAMDVAPGRKLTRRAAAEYDERRAVTVTATFLSVLTDSFPTLRAIADGVDPAEVRGSSLLTSTTMLRALAHTYGELTREHGASPSDVREYFAQLSRHMDAPVTDGSLWMKATPETDGFTVGGVAPGARSQQVKELVASLVRWGVDGLPS